MPTVQQLEEQFPEDVRRHKGVTRTPQQQKAASYFRGTGCMNKMIGDDEFDRLITESRNLEALKQKAMNKIGLDESELAEIPPVALEGYVTSKDAAKRTGRDMFYRTSRYGITWIFFSAKQIYLYRYQYSLSTDWKVENVEEYFYKDVTNFSTFSESEEAMMPRTGCRGAGKFDKRNVEYHNFALIVPGDKQTVPYTGYSKNYDVSSIERSVQAMKQKLREKKDV